MDLLTLILILVSVGILMYVINVYIPMEAKIKKLLNVVVLVIIIIWLLKLFGLFGPLQSIKIG